MPNRGIKENLNMRIITEELMEFHDVREFEGNLAAYKFILPRIPFLPLALCLFNNSLCFSGNSIKI